MRCHTVVKIKENFTGPICFPLFVELVVVVVVDIVLFVKRISIAVQVVTRGLWESHWLWVCVWARVAKEFSRLNCLTLEMENNFKLGANSSQVILLHFNTWTCVQCACSIHAFTVVGCLLLLRAYFMLASVTDGPTANTAVFSWRVRSEPWHSGGVRASKLWRKNIFCGLSWVQVIAAMETTAILLHRII